MERIKHLSNRIGEIKKELAKLPEQRRMLLKRTGFIEQEFLIEAMRYRCMCMPFYAAVKNSDLEKTSRLSRLLKQGADRYLDFVKKGTGFGYKEKKAQLPEKIREKLLGTIAQVDAEIEKKKNGPEKIQWDALYFFEEASKGTAREDWGSLWEEGLRVREALAKHHAKLSEELRGLERLETKLGKELEVLEAQKEAAVFSCKLEPLKRRAEVIGLDWGDLVNGLKEGTPQQRLEEASKKVGELEELARKRAEIEKTRKIASGLLEELAKSRYKDMREKAERLLQKIKAETDVLGTAAEAQSLKNTEQSRNSLRERLSQQFEETRKKSGLVQRFFQKLELKDSPAEELEQLGKEETFYAEGYLERFLRVQEEIYAFYGLITDLNNIGKHKEITLTGAQQKEIATAAQERDFDALEGTVQGLWEDVRNATKEGQTKNESAIMKKKKELGFGLKRDLVVLLRVENLKRSIGEGGLEILLKKSTVEYTAKHSHVLSGIRVSLQKLGFNPDGIMKADRVHVHMNQQERQRLQAILELEKMIKKETPAER